MTLACSLAPADGKEEEGGDPRPTQQEIAQLSEALIWKRADVNARPILVSLCRGAGVESYANRNVSVVSMRKGSAYCRAHNFSICTRVGS